MASINLGGSVGTTAVVAILGNYNVIFTLDADHTLSPTEYSNYFLEVTSSVSLTAQHNIIAPLVQGQSFIVQNSTTGGQSIQIIGVTGAGVVIAPDDTVSVVCDGTNYLIPSSGGSSGGNTSFFVFQPGGTAGGNVYTDESTLATAIGDGYGNTIFFDLSVVGGSYAFTTVGSLNLGQSTIWTDGFNYSSLTFANGTTIPYAPIRIEGTISISITQNTTVYTAASGLILTIYDFTSLSSTDGYFIDPSGNDLYTIMYGDSVIIGSPGYVFAGTTFFYLFDSAYLGPQASSGPLEVETFSPAVTVDSSFYTNFGTHLYIDSTGTAVAQAPPDQSVNAYIFQLGQIYYSNGSVWTPITSTGGSSYCLPYASRPAAGKAGNTFTASDIGPVQFIDDGTEWRPLIRGVAGWETAPGNSLLSYTQVGYAAPDTVNVQGGCLYFFKTGNAASILGYEIPKTSGQTFTVHFTPNFPPVGGGNPYSNIGIWARDTSGGKVSYWCIGGSGTDSTLNTAAVLNFSSLSTYNSTAYGPDELWQGLSDIWMQIVDNGTHLAFNYSFDGVNYTTAFTDASNYVPSRGNAWGFGLVPVSQSAGMTVDSILAS